MAKICEYCKNAVDDNASFCKVCGASLQNTAPQKPDVNKQSEEETPKNTKPTRKTALIIIAAVLIAAIAAGIVFTVFRDKPEQADNSEPHSAKVSETDIPAEYSENESCFDISEEFSAESTATTSLTDNVSETQTQPDSKKKAKKQNDSISLDSAIKQIKNVNFSCSFDASKYVSEELSAIKAEGWSVKAEPSEMKTYSWYVNGKIDTKKLYNKILSNNRAEKIRTDKKYISAVAQALADDVAFLKENFPGFDFGTAFSNIDALKVVETDNSEIMGCFSNTEPAIYINPKTNYDDESLRLTAGHEGFHLLFNQSPDGCPVYYEGVSVDILTNINSALSLELFSERYADSFSYLAIGFEDPVNYTKENAAIELLKMSTEKDDAYFEKAHVYADRDKLVEAFEPEYQKSALSCYAYANICCGYASFDGIEADEAFKAECYEQFRLYVLKNAYTRITREYFNGAITFDEGRKELNEIVSFYQSVAICGSNDERFEDIVKQLNTIYDSCK